MYSDMDNTLMNRQTLNNEIVKALYESEVRGRIKEHKVILGAVVEAYETASNEGLNGLSLFDNWRASRYKHLERRLLTLIAKSKEEKRQSI